MILILKDNKKYAKYSNPKYCLIYAKCPFKLWSSKVLVHTLTHTLSKLYNYITFFAKLYNYITSYQ